jgi:hypothetical protein
MARTAVLAKLAVVGIILGVARIAGGIEGGENVIQVTLRAFQAGVRSGQRKFRLRVVEGGRQPGGGGMALIALRAELAIMSVILGMAGIAGGIQGGEDVICMALRAFQQGVRTRKRKIGFGVVECSREPGSGGMALIASCSKLAVVSIVFGVAGVAGCIQDGEDVI